MSIDELQILGHLLIATSKKSNSFFTTYVESTGFWDKILEDCIPIAQKIPKPVREIVRKEIQTRGDNESVTPLQESPCQPDDITYSQMLQTPGEISQSLDADKPSATQAIPITRIDTFSAKQTSNAESPSVQAPITGEGTQVKKTSKQKPKIALTPFSHENLKVWAESPQVFLSLERIDVENSSVSGYIQELETSQNLNIFRIRFALRQLWISRECWRPRTMEDFSVMLGPVLTPTLKGWLREGRVYYFLGLHRGVEVLFSKLRGRRELQRLRLSNSKKRTAATLSINVNTEICFEELHAADAKDITSSFSPEELKVPHIVNKTGKTIENCSSDDKLYMSAAESITAYLKTIHRHAGLLTCDGTHPDTLAPSSGNQTEPAAKRHRKSHGSSQTDTTGIHNLLEESQDPPSAVDSVTCDNPMGDVNLGLQWSLIRRALDDDGNDNHGIRGTNPDHDASRFNERTGIPVLQERSPVHPNDQHVQFEQHSSQQSATCSNPERTTSTRATTALSGSYVLDPGQCGTSLGFRDAHDLQCGRTSSMRLSGTSVASNQLPPPDDQAASRLSEGSRGFERQTLSTLDTTPIEMFSNDAPNGLTHNPNLHSATSFRSSTQQQEGTQRHEASVQELQLQSGMMSPHPACSPQVLGTFHRAEMECDMDGSNNLTSVRVSMGQTNPQPHDAGSDPNTSRLAQTAFSMESPCGTSTSHNIPENPNDMSRSVALTLPNPILSGHNTAMVHDEFAVGTQSMYYEEGFDRASCWNMMNMMSPDRSWSLFGESNLATSPVVRRGI